LYRSHNEIHEAILHRCTLEKEALMHELLIATGNPGKLREIRAVLSELSKVDIELVTPPDVGISLEVAETGTTYAENAARKARTFAGASNLVTLADDSGLEVDALGGEPGIHSARYTGSHSASDADRRRFLLSRLSEHPGPWKARFICVVAIAVPAGEIYYSQGACSGEIIPQERGENGFGYDPVFLVREEIGKELTMAELCMEEKNRISHRARALRAALPILTRIFVPG
jgi:XTP/dITP diphosphohydrolase